MLTNLNNIVRYTVSGATYAITYPYWTTEEIKAYITLPDGTVTELTYGTDFTVTAPNGVNGTLTKVSAWTDAEKLTIVREVELTQEIDLINGEKIDGEQLETGLDLKTAGLQQLNEKFTRSVMTSIDETGDNMVIPNSTARKGTGDGTLLGFDGTGGNIVLRDLKQFDADVANTAANASLAEAAKNKANEWAEKATEVEPSAYSAKHWAEQAMASATSASNSATTSQQKAEDSESWAVGKRSGSDVPATDPAYHNNSKYYLDLVKQTISGALRYQGTWTTTSQTDYTSIPLPRLKGDMYYCQGTATTIDGVTYTQGDYIIFNVDVPSGTITTSMLDKIDNTETVTPDNLCTLTNKTIDGKDNTIKCSPTIVSTDTTITPTGEMNVVIDTDYACVTLASSAPYVGYRLPIVSTGTLGYGYVKFNSECICLRRNSATFIWMGSSWQVESGATFFIFDSVVSNAPTGVTLSGWKSYLGQGTYNWIYGITPTGHDIPTDNVNIAVTWRLDTIASAIATETYVLTGQGSYSTRIWVRRCGDTWSNNWTMIRGVQGTGALHTVTPEADFSGGFINYCVNNGMCTVTAWGVSTSTTGSAREMIKGLPKAKLISDNTIFYGTDYVGDWFIATGETTMKLNNYLVRDIYATLVYPVADDWVET